MADPTENKLHKGMELSKFATADPELLWTSLKRQMPDVASTIENMLINGKGVNEIMQFAVSNEMPEPVITGTKRAIAFRHQQIFGNRNIG
jgi:hypothetical protein